MRRRGGEEVKRMERRVDSWVGVSLGNLGLEGAGEEGGGE